MKTQAQPQDDVIGRKVRGEILGYKFLIVRGETAWAWGVWDKDSTNIAGDDQARNLEDALEIALNALSAALKRDASNPPADPDVPPGLVDKVVGRVLAVLDERTKPKP